MIKSINAKNSAIEGMLLKDFAVVLKNNNVAKTTNIGIEKRITFFAILLTYRLYSSIENTQYSTIT
ncbi:MAG: hypothetical protein ABIT96_00050 [Ferruginibacter sp.]